MSKEELDLAVQRRRQDFIDGCPKPCRGQIADLQDRLAKASDEMDRIANRAAAFHNMTEYTRACGKREGIDLALSYVDEIARA